MKQQYIYAAIVVILVAACVYLFTQTRDLKREALAQMAVAKDASARAKQYQTEADAVRAENEALSAELDAQKSKTKEIQRKYESIKGRYDRLTTDELQRKLADKLK